MEVVPERVYVLELPKKLKVSRSRVYQLLDALKIKTHKVGNKSFIVGDDYVRLVEVQKYIKKGRTIAEYLLENPQQLETTIHQEEVSSIRYSKDLSNEDSNQFVLQGSQEAIELLFSRLAGLTPVAPPVPQLHPIEVLKVRLETLAICARDGVILTNHELAELLGSNYNTVRKNEKFSQYGYSFIRHKEGRSIYWSISKDSAPKKQSI